MRAVENAGFECGIHTWDHVVWQDNVRLRGENWTRLQMQKSVARFQSIFGHAPKTHGAAGWQMNPFAFAELDGLDIMYASDGRAQLNEDGSLTEPDIGPYRLAVDTTIMRCFQMPTTLPTLDELLGRTINGAVIDINNIADHLLQLTKQPRDHVFTLHAELEGQKLAPIFERLLIGWQSQGYRFTSMAKYAQSIDAASLPIRPLQWGELPGRSGELVVT
jgi:peptidoglycan/xylan/chitin deacetylase (PgdA/CDA1 family)